MPKLNPTALPLLGAALAAVTVAAPMLLWTLIPTPIVAAVALAFPFLTMGLLEAASQTDRACRP
jgi:hypothetical protein